MQESLWDVIISWINSILNLTKKSPSQSPTIQKEEIHQPEEVKEEAPIIIQRKRNTNVLEYLQNYMTILKKQQLTINNDLDTAEKELINILEPYCVTLTLPCGSRILMRPLLPSDKSIMKDLIETGEVSRHSLSLRFNSVVTRIMDSSLDYFCSVNYDSHFAIGVQIEENGEWKGVASGRLIQDLSYPKEAEWAAIVVDSKHGHKIGSCILYYLSIMAQRFGIEQLMAVVHPENFCVLHWMKKLNAVHRYKQECDFYAFNTPISDDWLPTEEMRVAIQNGANAKTVLSDELREQLVKSVKDLQFYEKSLVHHESLLNSRKSPTVSPRPTED